MEDRLKNSKLKSYTEENSFGMEELHWLRQ